MSWATMLDDRLPDTLICIVVGIGSSFVIRNRRLAGELQRAMEDCRTAPDSRPTPGGDRLAAARRLSRAMFALHKAYAVAAGEPWTDRLPADRRHMLCAAAG